MSADLSDNIWGADLPDMQLINKYNNVVRFLLRLIDNYKKYTRVVPLKDKQVLQSLMHFKTFCMNIVVNKISVDQGSEFYNRSMKS